MTRSQRAKPSAPHIPAEGSKEYQLLAVLLRGVVVDPIYATAELNLLTVNARVSELRRRGWPIRSENVPHPKLSREKMPTYFLDAHFRARMTTNPGKHPGEYPHADGRGKYHNWTPAQFLEDHSKGGKK